MYVEHEIICAWLYVNTHASAYIIYLAITFDIGCGLYRI